MLQARTRVSDTEASRQCQGTGAGPGTGTGTGPGTGLQEGGVVEVEDRHWEG